MQIYDLYIASIGRSLAGLPVYISTETHVVRIDLRFVGGSRAWSIQLMKNNVIHPRRHNGCFPQALYYTRAHAAVLW